MASVLELEGTGGNPHDVAFPRPTPSDPKAERIYPGLYAFAFVRNPWDRLASCYRDKIGGDVTDFTGFAESGVTHCLARFDMFKAGMSFREFVHAVASIPDEDADEHFRSQADYVTNSSGEVAIDFVGRYEKLDNDFAQVAHEIGLPPEIKPPRLQAAPKSVHADYYTSETRALMRERYARDIDLFEYRFLSD